MVTGISTVIEHFTNDIEINNLNTAVTHLRENMTEIGIFIWPMPVVQWYTT